VVDQHREWRKIASAVVDGRWPVLVGVGFASQDVENPLEAVEVLDLMARAVDAAGADSGAPTLLADVGRILIPRGTWAYPAPGRLLAQHVGADGAHPVLAYLGVPQQTLINDALQSIRDGAVDAALVVGGEARQREVRARRAKVELPVTDQSDLEPDEVRPLEGEMMAQAEVDARAVLAVDQYALIERALGHAEGLGLAPHLDQISDLWSRFDAVAGRNPHAAFAGARSAEFLSTPGPSNRPIAFPYNKWHITQMNVDQSMALLFCSADSARAHGIPEDRCIHPHVALESSAPISLSRRRDMHRWQSMQVLGAAATKHLGRPLTSIEHLELYSCFPVAVRVQQRELELPLDGTPTITGGMAYAGGPLNSFVLHEAGEMALHLRDHPGELGLVGAVSGLLTKPGLSVWSTSPPTEPALVADLADAALAATPMVESIPGYEGPATVATYTVNYDDQQQPAKVIAIGDTPEGTRCVAAAEDAELASRATREDIIGMPIEVKGTEFRV
jgi:acetyl-CoA C-acetyltransferase